MGYPIKYISYSSLSKFHQNPGGWKETYILGNKYFKSSPAMLVGKMAHGVIELYMQGTSVEQAHDSQLAWFNQMSDNDVKWGKTGSREQVIKDFTTAVQMYFEEMPDYKKVLYTEKTLQSEINDIIDGREINSPLPFYGIPDLVYEDNGDIIIEDFKFKAAHTKDEDGPHPSYWIQSIFYYYLVKKDIGREPKEIRFREVKITPNRDKTQSQHNVIIINYKSDEFELHKAFFWYQLFGFCKFIEDADADSYFPYNIYDQLGGRETMELMQNTIFGYKQDKAVQSDLVKVDRAEFKETRFLETKAPETVEEKIKYKFQEFAIALSFSHKQEGYSFDRYLFVPSRGVKMSDIKKYSEDVAQATELENIRIIAPVPGTKYVGVEVPRQERKYKKYTKSVGTPIGVDIDGKVVPLDLSDPNTPHLIVAGRSGSGKSQFLKVLIESMPKKDYSLVLIDPKFVELSEFKSKAQAYANFPIDAYELLRSLKNDMEKRYQRMEIEGKTNIADCTLKIKRTVCIIEEYASLRLEPDIGKEIENIIVQLTNLGRAAGIHLILATQRPDVTIISGRIKANIGCRVCFATASQTDSKIIIEQPGAEKLGGKGDMLYLYPGQDPMRLQSFHL